MKIFGYRLVKEREDTIGNTLIQGGLITFTLIGALLISLELPEYGMIINGYSQIFWLYNTYKVWKSDKNQWGMLILSVIMALIISFGIINYWFMK